MDGFKHNQNNDLSRSAKFGYDFHDSSIVGSPKVMPISVHGEESEKHTKKLELENNSAAKDPDAFIRLVAESGRDLFMEGITRSSSSESENARRTSVSLKNSPSMIMFAEVSEILHDSDSTLSRLDESTSSSVYELRRQRSVVDILYSDRSPPLPEPRSAGTPRLATRSGFSLRQHPIVEESSNESEGTTISRSRSELDFFLERQRISKFIQKSNRRLNQNELVASASYSDFSARESKLLGWRPPEIIHRKKGSRVALFKPETEEIAAGIEYTIGEVHPLRAGMIIGGGPKRERAAYLLDKNIGRFSGVPETALVEGELNLGAKKNPLPGRDGAKSAMRGSIQRYCANKGSAEDHPDIVFKAPASEVHKIGILDIRIFNTDRHGGNILCNIDDLTSRISLIPIDHALSLPDWHFLSEAFFDWTLWPQSKVDFTSEALQKIESIDIAKDMNQLASIGIQDGFITTMRIATMALQEAARRGYTLHDIGMFVCRPFFPGHAKHDCFFSPLESVVIEACHDIGYDYLQQRRVICEVSTKLPQGEDLNRVLIGGISPPEDFFDHFESRLHLTLLSHDWKRTQFACPNTI